MKAQLLLCAIDDSMRRDQLPVTSTHRAAIWLALALGAAATSGLNGQVAAQDRLETASGKQFDGQWIDTIGPDVRFHTHGEQQPLTVPLAEVVGIQLAGADESRASRGPQALEQFLNPATGLDSESRALQGRGKSKAPPKPVQVVMLRGGGAIRGEVTTWSEGRLRIATARLGAIEIPHRELAAVVWRHEAAPQGAARVGKADGAGQDLLQVRTESGALQQLTGEVLGLQDGALGFRFVGQNRRVKLDRLVRADIGQPAKQDRIPRMTITWGELWQVPLKSALRKADLVVAQTSWGAALRGKLRGASLAVRNGRVVLLSDLSPAEEVHTPYFSTPFPWQRSAPPRGWNVAGKRYQRGIMMHSRTRLTYDLDGQYAAFLAIVGLQQPEGRLGNAAVEIQLDGQTVENWPAMRAGEPPQDLSLSLANAKRLTLIVDFGQDQDVGDRVVWADARLLRNVRPEP